jgi:hypothetical protein
MTIFLNHHINSLPALLTTVINTFTLEQENATGLFKEFLEKDTHKPWITGVLLSVFDNVFYT